MATVAGNVQKYMHTLSACIRSTDSAMLCRLLTTDLGRHWGGRQFVQAFAGQQVRAVRRLCLVCIILAPLQPAQYEQIVKSVVMSPRNWADVVLGHLACLAALASTDVDRSLACRHQCSLLENLVIVLSDSDTDWIAPAFRMVVVESRKLAVLSGQVRANPSKVPGGTRQLTLLAWQVGSSAQGSEESFLVRCIGNASGAAPRLIRTSRRTKSRPKC